MSIFPINPVLAAKAWKLSKAGLKGKAIAERLGKGITTDEANILASVGYRDHVDDWSRFSANAVKVLVGLLELERKRRRAGETSSPKAWMLTGPTGLSEGQIRRATKQLDQGFWKLLHHSPNGHIWLEPAGIAVARELSKVRNDLSPLDAAAPELLAVAQDMLPRNLCLTNSNIPDSTVVPLEVTMGELRKIAAVVAKATGK